MAKLRFKKSSSSTAATAAADASSLPPVANLSNGDVTIKLGPNKSSISNDKTDFHQSINISSSAADPQTSKDANENYRNTSNATSNDAPKHPTSYTSRKATQTTKKSRFSNPYNYRFEKYHQPSNDSSVGTGAGASVGAVADAGSSKNNLAVDSNNTTTYTTTKGNNNSKSYNETKKRGALAAVLRSFSQFAAAATTPAHPTTTTTTTNNINNATNTKTLSTRSNNNTTSTENTPTMDRSSMESNITTTTTTATQPLTKAPPPPYYLRGIDDRLNRNILDTSIDKEDTEAEKKTTSDDNDDSKPALIECPLCVSLVDETSIPNLDACHHKVCYECMQRYISIEINHSRVNIKCPVCSEIIHPNTIRRILDDEKLYLKYETFMLRRVLAADPDARWCPAPDCGYVVLAYGCASCPKLVCQRPTCKTSFCYHCKQEWHPNQTCSSASIQRNRYLFESVGINFADSIEQSNNDINIITATHITDNNQDNPNGASSANNGNGKGRKSSKSSQQTLTLKPEDVKECPVCSSRIIKMNDGSCNHMTCSICETEFCWLCMKEISDLHYFSPSGCTFWGKKPWSRKKKLLWRLGILVGAPICIIFIAGIAVPAIVIGIPVWAARKLHNILERRQLSRYRKNAIITGGVLLAFAASPFISAFALAVGIPFLLGYVYGVVPLSLCRSSGGCLSASSSVENLSQQQYQSATTQAAINPATSPQAPSIPASSGSRLSVTATESRLSAASIRNVTNNDVVSIGTAASHKLGNPSIGETSVYTSNMSLETNSLGRVTSVEREDRESASNAALAGSITSGQVEDGYSTKALAGSIISKESGYTLVPAEIHNNGNNINKQQDQ